ncbi:hypothetical protein [Massilia sp. ST3]|uniref:hypothetical protein n=1 Tax=Massilia sp. ST3 TaxID=2824903 RepID=UPI001B82B598|nr:hypothetical protein [Massilia sp. ST3]MBQ5947532.1 hypothetical protein [Massilia sp. ST3]
MELANKQNNIVQAWRLVAGEYMRWIQRIGLSAGVAAAAVWFLVLNGIFADEDALLVFGIIGGLMVLLRPDRIFHHKPRPEAGR